MNNKRVFSVQETQDIIKKLKSGITVNSLRREIKCGVNVLKQIIKENNIPYICTKSHANRITGEFANKFTKNSTTGNCHIVKSIKQHDLIPHNCCYNCGLTDWLGGKLILELDHINGDNTDNRLENLRFLCPNCHSQTENYKGRNINSGKLKVSDELLIKTLKEEGNIRKALLKVGLSPKGGNYERAYRLQQF